MECSRPKDADGLNQAINSEICNAVRQERANIFLWTGDIVNVTDRAGDKPEDKTQFLWKGLNKWHDIMGQLYGSDVKVSPVRGNHEVDFLSRSKADLSISANLGFRRLSDR